MGSRWPEGQASGQIAGSGKPVGDVPTSDPGESTAEAQVHTDLPAALGGAFESVEPMASGGPSHAAGNRQTMAYNRIPLLLELEIAL